MLAIEVQTIADVSMWALGGLFVGLFVSFKWAYSVSSKVAELERWKSSWQDLCSERRSNCGKVIDTLRTDGKETSERLGRLEQSVASLNTSSEQMLALLQQLHDLLTRQR